MVELPTSPARPRTVRGSCRASRRAAASISAMRTLGSAIFGLTVDIVTQQRYRCIHNKVMQLAEAQATSEEQAMTDLGAPSAVYNPFEPGFADDPYPHYQAMREADPVHHSPFGVWFLFGYDEVLRFLRDHTLSVEDRHANPNPLTQLAAEVAGDPAQSFRYAMLNRDPPDHTRLRRLVSKAFTPRTVETLRPRITGLVDAMLDAAERQGRVDLVDAL